MKKINNPEIQRIMEMSSAEIKEEFERHKQKMVSEGLESLHVTTIHKTSEVDVTFQRNGVEHLCVSNPVIEIEVIKVGSEF